MDLLVNARNPDRAEQSSKLIFLVIVSSKIILLRSPTPVFKYKDISGKTSVERNARINTSVSGDFTRTIWLPEPAA